MAVATDKIGLMRAQMQESYPIAGEADIRDVWQHSGVQGFSVAGFRCSQGGHTLVEGGKMLTTELFARPVKIHLGDFDPADPRKVMNDRANVTVAAGTLWSQLHHELNAFGLAPRVHQSSCHFSVGGSISVNCHGRDPREGPICDTVNWLRVLLPDGSVKQTHRGEDLFAAVVGGYGSCGIILEANLDLTPNLPLRLEGRTVRVPDYVAYLGEIVGRHRQSTHLHYGWLRCVDPDHLYDKVLSVSYVDDGKAVPAVRNDALLVEAWGRSELMRAGWSGMRQRNDPIKRLVWELMEDEFTKQNMVLSRLNWMRAGVSFTTYRGTTDQDILQEFFVPLARLQDMLNALRQAFASFKDAVNVLSTTMRVVRADTAGSTILSYTRQADCICIAVDMNVAIDKATGEPRPRVRECIQQCLEAAKENQGTYYLPYYPFASRTTFDAFYPSAALQRQAITKFNSSRKLDNLFAAKYL
jgi:decaprenylphospho-beta-D-ribofuranose 2-oxidase